MKSIFLFDSRKPVGGKGVFKSALFMAIAITTAFCATTRASAEPHPLTPQYCNLFVTYACYAKTLWHEEAEGGYWGDGFDAKNQNGAVRGNCNTLLTYAMLVRGIDSGWVHPKDMKKLRRANLDRHQLVDYIRRNLAYTTAHHKSSGQPVTPQWGYHWQSPLWNQAMGLATLLTWNDLADDLKAQVARVAAAEADWVASRPPHDMAPGNTAAEENAWNTAGPAIALALTPEATSATLWWNALKSYSVNTYSHPADRNSSATIGTDRVSDIVNTANVSADWSLINHGFFHPDYVQVSAQHLGEAWITLTLGDQIHGTKLASQYEPYSLHNVQSVWESVMRPLLMPRGEFFFPSGNDWTFHCSMNQSYFAFIATALNSYDAGEAEARALNHVKARREASPPGRLLGDSNLEWWWEPLVCKRMSTALLHHVLRPGVPRRPDAIETIDQLTTTVHLADARVWWHRTPRYIFSVSYGKPKLGHFVPLGPDQELMAYTTLPMAKSILPGEPWEFKPGKLDGTPGGTFWHDGRPIGAILCMPHSAALFSRTGFQPMRVENDTLTDPGRTVSSVAGKKLFPTLEKAKEVAFQGPWLNIDNVFGLITSDGFSWKPAGGWNMKSVAADDVKPRADSGVWQMLTATEDITRAVAETFAADVATTGVIAVIKDGPDGKRYRGRLTDEGFHVEPLQH